MTSHEQSIQRDVLAPVYTKNLLGHVKVSLRSIVVQL